MLIFFFSFPIRGNTPETRGTAYVVYEDIFDAKNACDHLSGFNVCNRYLVVLYYNANRVSVMHSWPSDREILRLPTPCGEPLHIISTLTHRKRRFFSLDNQKTTGCFLYIHQK